MDVRVFREPNGKLTHTVYRKPTHTDRYLRADSHHHPSHLSAVPRALINRALSLCDPRFVTEELRHVRQVLEDNGYDWRQCSRWANSSERKRPVTVERTPAYLPFIKGITDKIGHLLRRKYNIKTVFRPPGQLRQWLRSPKDRDHLNVPGVYMIPCECGKCYIGETRRNIKTRLTEHIRSVKNLDVEKSAVAEHACQSNATHFIRFDKATVLSREKFWAPRKIREAIEIGRHATFNRDRGWMLPHTWKPLLDAASAKLHVSMTNDSLDTISSVCVALQSTYPSSSEDEDESSASQLPPPPALTSRAARAERRSALRVAQRE